MCKGVRDKYTVVQDGSRKKEDNYNYRYTLGRLKEATPYRITLVGTITPVLPFIVPAATRNRGG